MSRWISAEWLKQKKRFDSAKQRHIVWMSDIYQAPSIDIVRCKECKWFDTDNTGETYCMQAKGLCDANADDYCSYGDRRE